MDNNQWENFIKECDALAKKYDRNLIELTHRLDSAVRDKAHARIIEEASKNKDLVGRYFKYKLINKSDLFRYYKVLSERSESAYYVECLVFDSSPQYQFDTKWSMTYRQAGDGFLGSFDFDSIWTDSELAKDIRLMEEITEDEYRDAMKQYIEQLLDMDWKSN